MGNCLSHLCQLEGTHQHTGGLQATPGRQGTGICQGRLRAAARENSKPMASGLGSSEPGGGRNLLYKWGPGRRGAPAP